MAYLNSKDIQIIKNDQDAINTAYQVADFALEERNVRNQTHTLNTILSTENGHYYLQGEKFYSTDHSFTH